MTARNIVNPSLHPASAWAVLPSDRPAFGWPGCAREWQAPDPAEGGCSRVGLGTAAGLRSRVWFTLGGGTVNEVAFPCVDTPCLRGLQVLVCDGGLGPSEAAGDLVHEVTVPEPGVPAYTMTSSDQEGRYVLHQRVLTDPERDSLVIEVTYEPRCKAAEDFAIQVAFEPMVGGECWHHEARVREIADHTALVSWKGATALALVCSVPLARASCGYSGNSDSAEERQGTPSPDGPFNVAIDGSVTLYGRIRPSRSPFRLALGFGDTPDAAVATAIASLQPSYDALAAAYAGGWQAQWRGPVFERFYHQSHDHGRLVRQSDMVLAALEDKTHRGAHALTLTPAGGTLAGSRPRDLCRVAIARLAAGDAPAAHRTLAYLAVRQRANGGWASRSRVDGTVLDPQERPEDAASVILLAWALEGTGDAATADSWPMVQQAALFLAREACFRSDSGERDGELPARLAVCAAAMACAATFAEQAGDVTHASYFLDLADAWAATIEPLAFAGCACCQAAIPGLSGHYGEADSTCECSLNPSFLAVVRYGLRAALDPRVEGSMLAVDTVLRERTDAGPVWRKGQSGLPSVELTGERAHYELAAGRPGEAAHLMHVLERLADPIGLLPERLPGAAAENEPLSPLAIAHAEYLTLARSVADGRPFARPEPSFRRYSGQAPQNAPTIWTFTRPVATAAATARLRLEFFAAIDLVWSADGWTTCVRETPPEIALGVWGREFPADNWIPGTEFCFTVHWREPGHWAGQDFHVRIT